MIAAATAADRRSASPARRRPATPARPGRSASRRARPARCGPATRSRSASPPTSRSRRPRRSRSPARATRAAGDRRHEQHERLGDRADGHDHARNNGGACSLANSGNGALTIAGVTNPPAQTITAANLTVATSTDTIAGRPRRQRRDRRRDQRRARSSFTGSPQTASARATWTIGFTTSATGALRAGDTITVGFSARFSIPANPDDHAHGRLHELLGHRRHGQSARPRPAPPSGPIVTITLANNGGTCALANSASGALTIAGIINVIATTITATNLTVVDERRHGRREPGRQRRDRRRHHPDRRSASPARRRRQRRARPGRSASPRARTGALRAGDTIIDRLPGRLLDPGQPDDHAHRRRLHELLGHRLDERHERLGHRADRDGHARRQRRHVRAREQRQRRADDRRGHQPARRRRSPPPT